MTLPRYHHIFECGEEWNLDKNENYFNQTIRFLSADWQPFIETAYLGNNKSYISGPFFGFLLSVAEKLESSLTFVGREHSCNGERMRYGDMDIILYPELYYGERWDELPHTNVLGILNLMSILSSKYISGSKQRFRFTLCFSKQCWLAILESFFTVSICSTLFNFSNKRVLNKNSFFKKRVQKRNVFELITNHLMLNLRFLLKQPPMQIFLKNYKLSRWLIRCFWQLSTLILVWAFESKLLEFTICVDRLLKIDSLSDMAEMFKSEKLEIVLSFEGESLHTYLENEENEVTEAIKPHFNFTYFVSDMLEWERDLVSQIATDKTAFVADDALLNYLYLKYRNKHLNLYRGKEDSEPQPYILRLGIVDYFLEYQFNYV